MDRIGSEMVAVGLGDDLDLHCNILFIFAYF